jgi:phosphoribosylamine--glycine ligase
MGAISPVPFVNQEFMEKVKNQIIIPTVKGLGIDGIEYDGFVFFGLIKVHGDPYVIEYNVRMGDPECEVVIPRLKCDLLDFFEGIASGTLSECDLQIDDRSTATVMMTSGGYPDKYAKGKVITGFEQVKDSVVFHSGTKVTDKGIVTNGGRVLAVTSYGSNYEEALKKSYENVERLQFKGMNYRPDIGFDLKKVVQKA